MSAAQLINYFPKYEHLDSVVNSLKKDRLNIFVDLKGCMTSLFQEWAVKTIVDQSKDVQVCDQSVFAAILEFVSYHRSYCRKRNLKLNMYFFMESGTSSYHEEIHKLYKKNRSQSDFFGLDDISKDLFFNVLKRNYAVAEKVCNKIPDIHFIRLYNLEADFLPHYLLYHYFPKEVLEESMNMIYSLDKDMLQCLKHKNVVQFYKSYKLVRCIFSDDIVKHYFKKEDAKLIAAEWFPLILSIDGDASDNFKGVDRVSLGTIYKLWDDISRSCISMDDVYKNIDNKTTIFPNRPLMMAPNLKKIFESESDIVRNLKLSSYDLLIKHMLNGVPTHMNECKQRIHSVIEERSTINQPIILKRALEQNGLSDILTEQTIFNLF